MPDAYAPDGHIDTEDRYDIDFPYTRRPYFRIFRTDYYHGHVGQEGSSAFSPSPARRALRSQTLAELVYLLAQQFIDSSALLRDLSRKQRADKCCSRSLKTINMVGNSKDFCSNAIEDLLPNKTGYPLEFEIELAKETSGQMEKEPQILGLEEATNAGIITVKKEDVAIKKPANIKKSDADVNGGNYVIDDIMHRDQIPVQQMICHANRTKDFLLRTAHLLQSFQRKFLTMFFLFQKK